MNHSTIVAFLWSVSDLIRDSLERRSEVEGGLIREPLTPDADVRLIGQELNPGVSVLPVA